MDPAVIEAERIVAQAVDFNDPASCAAVVKQLMEQKHLSLYSNNRRINTVATALGRSTGWVQRYVKFSAAVPEVLALYKDKVLLAVDVEALTQLPTERQLAVAQHVETLPTLEAVRLYLKDEVYKDLEVPVELARRGRRPTEEKSEVSSGEPLEKPKQRGGKRTRLETKTDCKLALTVAVEALDPVFDKPIAAIVDAFAGAPADRAEFLRNVEQVQQMLSVITTALKKEYDNG